MPKSSKNSLAAQLAELSNPAPVDFDPEDLDAPARPSNEDTHEEEFEPESKKKAPKKLPLRAAVELSGPKYAGKKVSRKDIEEEEEEEDDMFGDLELGEGDSEDEMIGGGGDDLESDGDEIIGGEEGDEESDDELIGGSEEGSEGEFDQEEDEDDEEISSSHKRKRSDMEDGEDEEEGEESAVAREMRELQEEEQAAMKGLAESAKEEYEKAQHVKNQKTMFSNFLGVRIKMQKCLSHANRLPQGTTLSDFASQDQAIAEKLDSCQTALTGLVDDLIALHNALIEVNPAVRTNPGKESAKSDDPVDQKWSAVDKTFHEYATFRDDAIERWNRKARIASGAVMDKSFKAINQSIVSQVNNVLSDKERLIKRTQMKRDGLKVFGKSKFESTDGEIFDDTDFYQQVLKEFIEIGGTEEGVADSRALESEYRAMRQIRSKKEVDRRASKGRKLRYTVQPKLVNFMVPIEKEMPPMADGLFTRLFGRPLQLA